MNDNLCGNVFMNGLGSNDRNRATGISLLGIKCINHVRDVFALPVFYTDNGQHVIVEALSNYLIMFITDGKMLARALKAGFLNRIRQRKWNGKCDGFLVAEIAFIQTDRQFPVGLNLHGCENQVVSPQVEQEQNQQQTGKNPLEHAEI